MHSREFLYGIFYGILLGAVWMLVTSCTSMPVANVPKPVQMSQTCANGTWCEPYDEIVLAHLTTPLMTVPYGDLCPYGVNPKVFWPALMKATAEQESDLKLDNKFTEKFPDSAGKAQVSQGLFQLSLDDAKRGLEECKGLTQANILTAEPNIRCALAIMDQLVRERGTNSLRAALGRYWSSIRDQKVDPRLTELVPGCFEKPDSQKEAQQNLMDVAP